MTAKWQGIDLEIVYQDWAKALGDSSIDAIGAAADRACSELEHPPNLAEFKRLCADYKPKVEDHKALPRYRSEAEKEFARQKMAEILAKFSRIS